MLEAEVDQIIDVERALRMRRGVVDEAGVLVDNSEAMCGFFSSDFAALRSGSE